MAPPSLLGNRLRGGDELEGVLYPAPDLPLDPPYVEVEVLLEARAAIDQLPHLLLELLLVVGVRPDQVLLVEVRDLPVLDLQDGVDHVQDLELLHPDLVELLHLLQLGLEGVDVRVHRVVDLHHAQGVDGVLLEADLGAYAAEDVGHVEVHEDVEHLGDHLVDLVPGHDDVTGLRVGGHQGEEEDGVEGVPVLIPEGLDDGLVGLPVEDCRQLINGVVGGVPLGRGVVSRAGEYAHGYDGDARAHRGP